MSVVTKLVQLMKGRDVVNEFCQLPSCGSKHAVKSVDICSILLKKTTNCVVCHMKDLPGFSHDQRMLRCWQSSQVIRYSSLALFTRSCCSLVNQDRPLG